MSLSLRSSLLILAIAAGLVLAWGAANAASLAAARPAPGAPAGLSTPQPLPEHPPVQSPDISFIDSPTAACVLPRAGTGVCYMTWSYMYATADPQYVISMTVEIDGKKRGNYMGFFQKYMYVPSEMLAFKVTCGEAGASGVPGMGLSHGYTLRGRDSAGLTAANYGSAICPADSPRRLYLPMLRK